MASTYSIKKELHTSFGKSSSIPDPANIQTAGHWYYLEHISESLLRFDPESSSFIPALANSWKINENKIIFTLKNNLRFSDGSSIKSRDVEASIKRLIIKKASTHFKIWTFVQDCSNITRMSDECNGIRVLDDYTIEINLISSSESFLLFAAGPECGIWYSGDIDEIGNLKSTKYSGPYLISYHSKEKTILEKNAYSEIIQNSSLAPEKIVLWALSREDVEKRIVDKTIDLFIGDYIPENIYNWKNLDKNVHYTVPISLIYLVRLGNGPFKQLIGKSFIESLKSYTQVDSNVIMADTFFPAGVPNAMSSKDFYDCFPLEGEKSRVIYIAAPDIYFQKSFLNNIVKLINNAGYNVVIDRFPINEYFKLFDLNNNSKYDFALTGYVASERFPAMQLQMLSNDRPLDFSFIDAPDNSIQKQKAILKTQKILLTEQLTVPLFVVRSHIVAQKDIYLSNQPNTEADLFLWKINSF